METKICPPFKGAKLSDVVQKFGVNPYSWQPKGHTGIDVVSSYGTFLVAPEDCVVRKITKAENYNESTGPLSNGYGICLVSENRQYLHWHCLPVFPVKDGDVIKQGQIVAQMGNSGFVISGGMVVPVERRTKPPYPGTHDHFQMLINNSYVDPLKYIDWDIPINYDVWTAIKAILNNLTNLLGGRR